MIDKKSYVARALSGELAPGFSQQQAFAALEQVLADMIDVSIANAQSTTFLIDHVNMKSDDIKKAKELSRAHTASIQNLSDSMHAFIEQAKGADRGNG